jgi:hypothetical protein
VSRSRTLSDAAWARIEPLMPVASRKGGRPFQDHRGSSKRSCGGIGRGRRGATCRPNSGRGRRCGNGIAGSVVTARTPSASRFPRWPTGQLRHRGIQGPQRRRARFQRRQAMAQPRDPLRQTRPHISRRRRPASHHPLAQTVRRHALDLSRIGARHRGDGRPSRGRRSVRMLPRRPQGSPLHRRYPRDYRVEAITGVCCRRVLR